ncbi:PhoH family protein (plasmid) [Aneurinibacillus sp. Ricciae_BoGa-3]|uniref:PhoH family protein n=1 Tax=Aneurinibacillus sp. Ricciae_BoGa-3 TaxID=3022697 RepID=UPI00233FF72D|nr:PhoH family protein [Aneurinibacillus sp. Ricciae_BoGa-3]WCK57713.1 PhoH family protein [Aneurinibacillus sp. Ricciae_BoGa-3]
MSKKFVADTSVLLYDVDALYKFEDNEVIIPSVVYEEINHLKDESSERGYYARIVSKILDELSQKAPLKQGVRLGQTLIRTSYDIENEEISKALVMDKNDYKIIACAKNNNATLISRDRMMRVIARDFVEAEEYKADMIKTEIYKGYRKLTVPEHMITRMFEGKLGNEFDLFPNEFVILENQFNPQHIAIGIRKHDQIIPVDFDKLNVNGMRTRPKNLEQKMFLYLLQDKDITCVTAMGVSGKGKSLEAIDYSLSAIINNIYHKLLYTKSSISVDKREELGFYKGDVEEKLRPHLQPFYSSIEFLFKQELYSGKDLHSITNRLTVDQKVEELLAKDMLDFIPLANIRGMSVFEKVIILDEAQNTTNHMIKTLVTRVNDDGKLIVTGDVEQIDDPNLNQYNNGLVHLIEEGKEEDFIGHITMDIDPKTKRGRLAEFGARKL